MKKYFLILFVVTFVSFIAYSCAKESEKVESSELSTTTQEAFDSLNAQIDALNAEYKDSLITPVTRGPRWRRFWRIFSADALGGAVGGGLFGIFGALFF